MQLLRTNTATRITVGPFLDKTDGVTPEVAITVTAEKLTFVVDTGGVPTLVLDTAPTASGGNNDMVHITNDDAGYYDLELAAADVNYLGRAKLALTDATVHCPVFHEFMIVPAMVYDSLVLGTDVLQADTTQWLGTACATPTTNGVPEVDVTHVAGTAQTAGDLAAMITAVDDFVDTEVAAIKTKTDFLPSATAGAAGGLFIAGSNSATTVDITGSLSGSVGSVTAAVTVGTNNDKTGYSLSAAGVQAIWDALTSALTTAGSIGKKLADWIIGTLSTGAISSTTFSAGAIDAAAIAADFTTEVTAGIRIKKNTALSNFMFLMVDSTDHITPKTGLTITATRSIDGAAFAACANAAVEVANGMYKINLAATDLNGDVIALKFAGGATADDRLLTIITTA